MIANAIAGIDYDFSSIIKQKQNSSNICGWLKRSSMMNPVKVL